MICRNCGEEIWMPFPGASALFTHKNGNAIPCYPNLDYGTNAEPDINAWRITPRNGDILSRITGLGIQIFQANVGWVVVEDWNQSPRFVIVPFHTFREEYPGIKLGQFSVDKEATNG